MILSELYWKQHVFRNRIQRYWRLIDSYNESSCMGRANESFDRIKKTLLYFASRKDALPEWKEVATIEDPSEFWRAWRKLPILTKDDLRERFEPERLQRDHGIEGVISSTGGSTGEPTPFLHTTDFLEVSYAASLYVRKHFGWHFGMPTIILWGSERDIGKQNKFGNRLSSFVRNEKLIDGYKLSDETTDRLLGYIHKNRVSAVYGFTSLLEFVARQVLERGITVPSGKVSVAWNGGEMLSSEQSELFREAFGVPIFNLYGGRELSAMAFQNCRDETGLAVLKPFVHLEIVDEQGEPTPPGEIGRLIWTSTICFGTPFLRYDIGDLGVAEANDCHGVGVERISRLEGRRGGLMKLSNGRVVGGLFWNHLFKDFAEIRQFQVTLARGNNLVLRLVGDPFGLQREFELRRLLENMLGNIEITIGWVDSIPLTPQGKLEQVITDKE